MTSLILSVAAWFHFGSRLFRMDGSAMVCSKVWTEAIIVITTCQSMTVKTVEWVPYTLLTDCCQ